MKRLLYGILFSSFIQLSTGFAAPVSGHDLYTGTPVELKVGDKKALVLIFLSNTCPNSQSHIEEIKKMAVKYSDFTFAAVHSNSDESLKNAQEYFKKAKLPFSVLQDENNILADQFKAVKTPQSYVIAANGSILYQGGITDSAKPATATKFFLKNALDDIEHGRSVKVPEGRVLGCVISRAKESSHVW